MDDFLERWRVPIIAVLTVLIAGGLVVLYMRWPRTTSPATRSGASVNLSPQSGNPVVKTAEPRQSGLKVYVTGAVAQPGVYAFRDGERGEDALKSAGGALADADLSRLNLAQRLRDEGYIVVPRQGETPVPGASSEASPGSAAAGSQSGKLNINTATLAQLDALPGIGAVYAQRILDYRVQNGPFQTVSDLADKKLVPQGTLDKIKDTIDVR
jgi:competence protein ComEA